MRIQLKAVDDYGVTVSGVIEGEDVYYSWKRGFPDGEASVLPFDNVRRSDIRCEACGIPLCIISDIDGERAPRIHVCTLCKTAEQVA